MVLVTVALPCMWVEIHEGNDEIEDEDDNFLLSRPFPEPQSELQIQLS